MQEMLACVVDSVGKKDLNLVQAAKAFRICLSTSRNPLNNFCTGKQGHQYHFTPEQERYLKYLIVNYKRILFTLVRRAATVTDVMRNLTAF